MAILRLRERLGDNQRARLRCVEKVRLRNEANKFHDWKRRGIILPDGTPAAGTWRHATTKNIKTPYFFVLYSYLL